MNDITIDKIGPIHHLSLHIKPGVNVLRGVNGCGKTESLAAVGNLLRGNGKLSLNDEAMAGSVEGLGVQIRVRKSTRYDGELEVESLEGKFDVGDLVTPTKAHKNPEAVDRHRIRALIALEGTEADPALYYDLIGKELLEKVMPAGGLATKDPLEMGKNIHDAFHAAKRNSLGLAEKADANVEACWKFVAGVDNLHQESNVKVLQDALETSLQDQARIKEQRTAATEAGEKAAEARDAMSTAAAEYDGPCVAEAKGAADEKGMDRDEAATALARAREVFDKATSAAAAAKTAYDEAVAQRNRAVQHENMLATWKSTIDDAADVTDPGEEAAEEADQHLTAARTALEHGHMIRLAWQKQDEATQHRETATEHRSRAERLRLAADTIDDVLSRQIATPLLRVKAGRLVTEHARGRDTLYDVLSDGERWTIALQIVITVVGEGGLLILRQEGWQGLDPHHRKLIAEMCEQAGVSMLTAEATDGDLRVEHYQADMVAA